jgi:NAD(P)-dependent dehydrogenase (short-subunit alcohol dehydrogenase family)
MERRLGGKVVALTGASKGLGRTLARALAHEGAALALLARPSSDLESLTAELDGSIALACDVSDADSVRKAFGQLNIAFGKLDVLINNAAVSFLNQIETASDEEIHAEIGANLLGPIFTIREAIPLMRGRDALIINVSSLSARQPFPFTTLYSTTKAALETLSFALQTELRPQKIRVATLRLGAVKTGKGLTRNWPAEKKSAYLQAVRESGKMELVGGWMTPDAISEAFISIITLAPEINPGLIELSGR